MNEPTPESAPGNADDTRVCAVCGRVLDIVVGAGWKHTVTTVDDHPAVPALPTEVDTAGVCDFCFAPQPRWELPARDFLIPWPTRPDQPDAYAGNWGCCDGCAEAITANRWNTVLARVAAAHERLFGEAMPASALADVRRLHRLLRANVTGPVRPSTLPRPGDQDQQGER